LILALLHRRLGGYAPAFGPVWRLKKKEFVERASAGRQRLAHRHASHLPNIIQTVIVQAGHRHGRAVLASDHDFSGLGVPPPTASGVPMLNEAAPHLFGRSRTYSSLPWRSCWPSSPRSSSLARVRDYMDPVAH